MRSGSRGCLLCLAALSLGLSGLTVWSQPVVETALEPLEGHVAGQPVHLVVTVTWERDRQMRGVRLSARPELDDLELRISTVQTAGANRLEFRIVYVPIHEGTFDLEPITVAYLDPDQGELEVAGLSRRLTVGPAPPPWWKSAALVWVCVGLLTVVFCGSLSVAFLKARRRYTRMEEAPPELETAEVNAQALDERLLDAQRKRLDGDLPGFASAIDAALTEAILETCGLTARAESQQPRLAGLSEELPESLRGRALRLAVFCEELRYARPMVGAQELDGAYEDARSILRGLPWRECVADRSTGSL